jgi:hypothetical protein
MFYMVGDNNLSDDMIRTLHKVRVAGNANDKVAIYAQFDGPHPMFKSSRFNLQKALPNAQREDYRVDIDHESSATVESIAAFVLACIQGDPENLELFPGTRAKHYALVLSGHGDGIQQRTLLLDDSPEGSLSISDVKTLLDRIKTTSIGKSLDILGFDSCLMNSLEVSYELRDYVHLLVASQGNIPNAGWDISSICAQIDDTGDRFTPHQLAVDVFAQTLKTSNLIFATESGRSADVSVCDLSKLQVTESGPSELLANLESFVSQLNYLFDPEGGLETDKQVPESDKTHIRWVFMNALNSARLNCQKFLSAQSIDLYDFCWILNSELEKALMLLDWAQASSTADTLRARIGVFRAASELLLKSIKENGFVVGGIYSGAESQFANGVSIFFPWTFTASRLIVDSYGKLQFAKDPSGKAWMHLIESVLTRTHRGRRHPKRFFNAPPFNKNSPPFYRGSDTFVEYFRRLGNFVIDPKYPDGDSTQTYN